MSTNLSNLSEMKEVAEKALELRNATSGLLVYAARSAEAELVTLAGMHFEDVCTAFLESIKTIEELEKEKCAAILAEREGCYDCAEQCHIDELNAARKAITKALESADEGQLKKLLCASFGHPPVVTYCFGYHNCARCGAQVGDSIGGTATLVDTMAVGHECEECKKVEDSLTPEQKLLTTLREPAAPTL